MAGALLWAVCGARQPVRVICQRFDARTTSMRGGDNILAFEPEDPVRVELTRRVKAAFDPLHLFNPGRMWEGV
jgi:late competence protein required for DNA uptake (superfamily II DNA/RNA helicase)